MTKEDVHNKAKLLRKNGMSIKQIAHELQVSSSSASIWVRDVVVTKKGITKLTERLTAARVKSGLVLRNRKEQRELSAIAMAKKLISQTSLKQADKFLIAALIYECEGAKTDKSSLEFTNSDPLLIKIFLKLLRETFQLDESKFRVIMHLHSYHSEKAEKQFWSKVTNIPEGKFYKAYQKVESGNAKAGYRGCVQIKYFDVTIKRTLLAGKTLLAEKMGL